MANAYEQNGQSSRVFASSGYDPTYGYAFAAPSSPLDRAQVNPKIVYRDTQIVASTGTWTYPAMLAALREMRNGIFVNAADLVEDLFADDRVQACLGSRTGGLFGRPVTHAAARGTPEGIECMAAWKEAWPECAPQTVLADIKRWAILLGWALVEVLWVTDWETALTMPDGTEVQRKLWRPVLKPWHPKWVYYRWDIRRYVATTMDGPVVVEPGNGKWLLHAPFGPYRAWMHGAARSVAPKWFIKELAWRDHARYNEVHGQGVWKAKIPAAGDPVQKEAFVRGLANLGQSPSIGLPQNVDGTGYDVDLLEARARTYESFCRAREDADRAMTLAIKSNNLTTEVGDQGSYAAARQHGHTDQSVLEFDEAALALDLHTQLAPAFALYNYGDPALAPWTRWNITPPEDYLANGEAWKALTTGMRDLAQGGLQLSRRAFAKLAEKQLGVRLHRGDLKRVDPKPTGLGGGQ